MSKHVDRACEWVYEGTWGILAAWFKVPRDSPTLPAAAGETIEIRRPDVGFLRYLTLQFWIGLAIIDLLLTGLWIMLLIAVPWVGIIIAPLAWALIILPDIAAYVALHLRYDTTWYVFSNRSVRIRRGIWTIQETTITYENIQNVSVRQGPLQRYFGISDIVIETAGGGGISADGTGALTGAHVGFIEGVADAATIRDAMLARIRATRSAGLGDERACESSRSATAHWTPNQLQRLTEIRDLARALASSSAQADE